MISQISDGTSRMARQAPAKSTGSGAPSACTISASGIATVSMCAKEARVRASAMTSEVVMPSWPIASPAMTDVTMKLSPLTMPTRPFARSRSPSGMSSVTTVERAMPRADSMIPPASSMSTNATNGALPIVSRTSRGVRK